VVYRVVHSLYRERRKDEKLNVVRHNISRVCVCARACACVCVITFNFPSFRRSLYTACTGSDEKMEN
jgi:hypothetical protein